jgi:hypothetical protein
MASFLDTIATEIAKGFKGKLRTGTLRRGAPGAGVDAYGDAASVTYTTYTCEGVVSDYSAFYQRMAQIPDTDVRLLLIAGSVSVTPQQDDQVYMDGRWYQIRMVRTDPATAAWDCQSYVIADPT